MPTVEPNPALFPENGTPRRRQVSLRYDPFGLMPAAMVPARPRLLLTGADVQRVRRWSQSVAWVRRSQLRLLRACRENLGGLCRESVGQPVGRILAGALRFALAYQLTGEAKLLAAALPLVEQLLNDADQMPMTRDRWLAGGSLGEAHTAIKLAQLYDLLLAAEVAGPLVRRFRALLGRMLGVLDWIGHRACGNHNTWSLAARLCIGSALGRRQMIHDALYGCPAPPIPQSPDTPAWRYGLVHQLRHDFMSDGAHWERTIGYHHYTLMAMAESAFVLGNLGVNLWTARLPTLRQAEGADLHDDYDRSGQVMLLQACHTLLYSAMANGDVLDLHDSGVDHVEQNRIWGPVYALAADATGDRLCRSLVAFTERLGRSRQHRGIPMSLQTVWGDVDFVRLRSPSYGASPRLLVPGQAPPLPAQHSAGCTLLPHKGDAILRRDPSDPRAPAVHLYFGRHVAGHQSPACLHLAVHAHGQWLTAAQPHGPGGYDNPIYPAWRRTTIAYNTVTVDQTPMFPYDLPTQSIWEADRWRSRSSEGELLLFQTGTKGGAAGVDFHAVRARNQNVYPGVCLDRTIVLTDRYVLDFFRCSSDQEHVYDWAMHLPQPLRRLGKSRPVELAAAVGYRQLHEVRRHTTPGPRPVIQGQSGRQRLRLLLAPPADCQLLTARAPTAADLKAPGHGVLLLRCQSKAAIFASVWDLRPGSGSTLKLGPVLLGPNGLGHVTIHAGRQVTRWELPRERRDVACLPG